ncbi:hypothetical protein CIL05_05160 [Virgibacillus profundi]|uniref:Aminoglycoside phosphotransferase domain-containing protein n=1 Tax=Virgibacillus profundi TaxID=2024555 RepID=A0A2A2IHA0_9BACI|nr:aminoglycoside phosphotransferase family protein [Virgibacillus profundi]PAV30495.1 hypothetical protein CIL05_05160 [Virgibacillus profundi]PXY54667.1 aminoglycoside phosphotransferase family protein [Virgibacillus profundi]
MDYLSEQIQKWVVSAVGKNAAIVSIERLKGSTSSVLHKLTLKLTDEMKEVVVRQYDNKEWLKEEPDLALHEAGSLFWATDKGLSAPEVIAYEERGKVCGVPLVLMSKVTGTVELKPQDMSEWIDGLAKELVKIHTVDISDFPWKYFSYNDMGKVEVPGWSSVPGTWKKVIEMVKGAPPKARECFIHRDYHPANVLWESGSVSGVVDWVNACMGPAGIDVGHCRWNLAMLYDVETADEFLSAYQGYAGPDYVYDPYWDLISLIDVLFGPPEVYPGWKAFGVTELTNKLMEERMDKYAVSLVENAERSE